MIGRLIDWLFVRITKIVELVSVAIVEFTQAEFLGVQDHMGRGVPTPDYLTQVTKNYSILDMVSTTRLPGKIASYILQITRYLLQIATYLLKITRYLLQITRYLLQITRYIL